MRRIFIMTQIAQRLNRHNTIHNRNNQDDHGFLDQDQVHDHDQQKKVQVNLEGLLREKENYTDKYFIFFVMEFQF
jgi:hypothetical protein